MIGLAAPEMALTLNPAEFSPNGDGIRDEMTLTPTAQGRADVAVISWTVTIADTVGAIWAAWSGEAAGPIPILTWNGRRADGAPAPDGLYTAALWALAENAPGVTRPLTVSMLPPAAPVILAPAGAVIHAWQTARGTAATPGLVEVLRVAGGSETRVYAVAHDGMWQADSVPLAADTPNVLTARLQNAAGVWSAWSTPVVVTVMVVPPLYSVGLRPAVVNLSATLHATATARGLSETVPGGGGAVWPVVRSVSAYPLGTSAATQTVSLTRTQAAASLTVWETWRPAGVWDCALSQCEYEIRFEGVDAEGYVGWGHTAFRLDKSKPTAPRIRQPASNDADGLMIHWTWQPTLTVAGAAASRG